MREIDDRKAAQAFYAGTVAGVTQFLSVVVHGRQARHIGLELSHKIHDPCVSDLGVPKMLPLGADIVVRLVTLGDHSGVMQPVYRELQGQFDRMSAVVQDRHGERVSTAEHLLVDDGHNEFARSLNVAVDIGLLAALHADTGVPESIGDLLEEGVGVRSRFGLGDVGHKVRMAQRRKVGKRAECRVAVFPRSIEIRRCP